MQSSSKAEPQESPGQLKKKLWPAIKKLVKVFLPFSAQQWLWRTKRRYLPAFGESTAQRNHLRAGAWDAEPLPGARFDVVCFSVIDWDFRFQRPQQLMTSLAEAGHRVFYLSQHFRGAGQPFQLKKIRENLYEVSLRGPAINPYTGKLNQAGLARLQSSLNALRRELGLGATLSVVQLPFWWPLAQALRQECAWPVLYDCMDFHAGFSTNRSRMLQIEEDLLKGADHVVVSSLYLQEQVRPFNDRVSLIRNACDYEHFAQVEDKTPAQRPPTQRPQIGYYGAIADWFDSDLMADLAQRRPDWDFLLVGATATADLKRLSRLPNVQLLGEQPYASLPDWLRRMDVLLIPFKRLPLTEATNPVKAYEILAAGKPLVSVPLPEIVALNEWGNEREPLIQLASTVDEFVREIETALADNTPQSAARRRTFARAHTWQARCDELLPTARACFPQASVVIVTYHNRELNRDCLKALYERTEWPNFEVFVVDNASTDGTPQMLRELAEKYPKYSGLTIMLNQQNLGFAKANNQALRQVTGEYLVLLNNDTVITRGWLSGLIRHLSADEKLGLIGPVTNEIGNEAKVQVSYQNLAELPQWARRFVREHDNEVLDIPMLAMFCVALRRSTFSLIGELDERFGTGMFEDDDYTRRVRQAGLKVQCAQDVFIHHHGRAAFKKMPADEYRTLFETNRRLYEEKWGEPWTPHQARR